MNKKILAALLVGVMTLSTVVTGCGSKESDGTFVPKKTLQWMCTSSPGGGSDIFSRMITDIMVAEDLINGQTAIVTNKTDGAGEVGRNEVANLTKDADYQLMSFNSGDLMPMVLNTKNRSANFRILAIMAVDKQLLFKSEHTKYNDFTEVLAACQAGTKVVVGGSKGDDVATYQALLEEVGLTEDVLTYITYDSTGDAITAALGGHVDILISKPAAASEYVEAGSLAPILALANERYGGNLADAPTLSEIGDYENVEIPVWRGVVAPKAMSDEAYAFWDGVLGKVSETEKWKTDYLDKNKLIGDYKNAAAATEFVTQYEADYMEEQGIE